MRSAIQVLGFTIASRFLELLPVRRVLERCVVLGEGLFRFALVHEHIAPGFERVGPVRAILIGELEPRGGPGQITVLRKRDAL
jgi:hypothetical protein